MGYESGPPGILTQGHTFSVPLDHRVPDGESIEVYARELVAEDHRDADLPWLLFLEGGPGNASARPVEATLWQQRALREFRLLMLDQRGTGRSTPITPASVGRRGDLPAQAAYLKNFRADSIVRDAEVIRRALIGDRPWSVLGHSFGGFCATSYLSLAPEGLREVFISAGLPPVAGTADSVYRASYRQVYAKNAAYLAEYPDDEAKIEAIVAFLRDNDVRLPRGDRLTPERFQMLGIALGMAVDWRQLHYIVEDALVGPPAQAEFSAGVLADIDRHISFARHPLFALLHEPIYSQGQGSAWAAQRIRAEYPEFDVAPGVPFRFLGEMIYPWMFEQDPALQPYAELADRLARDDQWPALYDLEVLAKNTVPVSASIYYNDMYVDFALSMDTADRIRGLHRWVTNEFEHDGIRADERVLDRLIHLARSGPAEGHAGAHRAFESLAASTTA
jgi:pimeloyl-ACP methyl ester carboxylesterase